MNIKEYQFCGRQEVPALLFLILARLKYLFLQDLSISYLFMLIFKRILRSLSIFHREVVLSQCSRIKFHRKTLFPSQVQAHH